MCLIVLAGGGKAATVGGDLMIRLPGGEGRTRPLSYIPSQGFWSRENGVDFDLCVARQGSGSSQSTGLAGAGVESRRWDRGRCGPIRPQQTFPLAEQVPWEEGVGTGLSMKRLSCKGSL